jgi:thioesterase domain-containing protein
LAGIPQAHLTIPEMARHCVQTLQRQQPHGPYFLGGLCAGGEIAFEAARQLEAQGEVVEAVLLLDAVPPTTPQRPWRLASQRWRRFSAVLVQPQRHRRAPWRQAVGKVGNLLRYEATHALQWISVSVRQRLLEHVVANRLAWPAWVPSLSVREIYNIGARANYRPGTVRAPVVLAKTAAEDETERGSEGVSDPFLGWRDFALGRLDVINAPGGHGGMLQEPHVDRFARQLIGLLDGAR